MDPPSFVKETAKVSDGSPKKASTILLDKAPEAAKDSKKRVWGFLSIKNVATRALELKKFDPSGTSKESKDISASTPKKPLKKKLKHIESPLPLGKFPLLLLFKSNQYPSLILLIFQILPQRIKPPSPRC